MAGIEIATKKYWEKPVFSQLMKWETITIKGMQKGQQKLLNVFFYQKYLPEMKIQNNKGSRLCPVVSSSL